MDLHLPGALASERNKRTHLKHITNWLVFTEENRYRPQQGVAPPQSGAPYIMGPDGQFHEVIRIDHTGRPISTPNYNELNRIPDMALYLASSFWGPFL